MTLPEGAKYLHQNGNTISMEYSMKIKRLLINRHLLILTRQNTVTLSYWNWLQNSGSRQSCQAPKSQNQEKFHRPTHTTHYNISLTKRINNLRFTHHIHYLLRDPTKPYNLTRSTTPTRRKTQAPKYARKFHEYKLTSITTNQNKKHRNRELTWTSKPHGAYLKMIKWSTSKATKLLNQNQNQNQNHENAKHAIKIHESKTIEITKNQNKT